MRVRRGPGAARERRSRLRAAMIARRLERSRFGRRHDARRRHLARVAATAVTAAGTVVLAVLLVAG